MSTRGATVRVGTVKRVTLGGAILAAIAASSCCIGPLILAAIGVGGAGAVATLSAYRPYILGVTAMFLGAGFYLTYRKPRRVAGDACACEKPSGQAGKVGLWIATVVVALVAFAPTFVARSYETSTNAGATYSANIQVEQAVVLVQGADCQACAGHIKVALKKVGGFRDLTLDVPNQRVTIAYEPAPGRLDAYVDAINALGYQARVTEKGAGP